MVEFKDYYKTLGIAKNSSDAVIKNAYKKLAKKFHPDAEGGSEEKFKEINEAHEVLKDKSKRLRYDSLLRTKDPLSSNFDSKTQAFKQHKMYSDFSSYSEFKNAEEEFRQKTKDLKKDSYSENSQETKIHPSKDESNFSDFFEMLFGKYKEKAGLKEPPSPPNKKPKRGEDFEMDLELSLEDAYQGTIRKIEITAANKGTRRLEVNIPAGVREGNRIKVSNEGKPGSDGASNGDLYLRVKYKEHPVFWLEGDDVHCEVELLPHEAVLGGSKTVITLEGHVELIIPPRTQNGKVLRLRNKGLLSKEELLGDQYVHISIKIPEDLSSEQIRLYEELEKLS
jgi:DnaJ-class molecular chaperone